MIRAKACRVDVSTFCVQYDALWHRSCVKQKPLDYKALNFDKWNYTIALEIKTTIESFDIYFI